MAIRNKDLEPGPQPGFINSQIEEWLRDEVSGTEIKVKIYECCELG